MICQNSSFRIVLTSFGSLIGRPIIVMSPSSQDLLLMSTIASCTSREIVEPLGLRVLELREDGHERLGGLLRLHRAEAAHGPADVLLGGLGLVVLERLDEAGLAARVLVSEMNLMSFEVRALVEIAGHALLRHRLDDLVEERLHGRAGPVLVVTRHRVFEELDEPVDGGGERGRVVEPLDVRLGVVLVAASDDDPCGERHRRPRWRPPGGASEGAAGCVRAERDMVFPPGPR